MRLTMRPHEIMGHAGSAAFQGIRVKAVSPATAYSEADYALDRR